MDWKTIRCELPEEMNRTRMMLALEELIRQHLEECHGPHYHRHECNESPGQRQTGLNLPADDPYRPFSQSVSSYLDKVCDPLGTCSPIEDNEDDEIWVGDKVRCVDNRGYEESLCLGKEYKVSVVDDRFLNTTESVGTHAIWEKGRFRKVQPRACDHPCHKYPQDIGVEPWLWKVCPMGCGLPLKEKEEKP